MGVAPPAPEPAPAPQVRVKAPTAPPPVDLPPPSVEELERDELARALEEIQAEEMRERERLKR
jgi:hypothetical protein